MRRGVEVAGHENLKHGASYRKQNKVEASDDLTSGPLLLPTRVSILEVTHSVSSATFVQEISLIFENLPEQFILLSVIAQQYIIRKIRCISSGISPMIWGR